MLQAEDIMVNYVDQKSQRDAYAHSITNLMEREKDILVFDADLARSTRNEWVKQRYPNQFLNAGIAEQNMVCMAAGASILGFKPYVATYAIFLGRAFDSIRESIGYANTNVNVVSNHAGLACAYDGGTHQSLEDLALMRSISNMRIFSPADYWETISVVEEAARHTGPCYLRIQKENVPTLAKVTGFRPIRVFGKTITPNLSIVATGTRVIDSLTAASRLLDLGISARVINIALIQPFPKAELLEILGTCSKILIVEEHGENGGLYEATCSTLIESATPRKVRRAGMTGFGESGSWRELLSKYQLDADGIYAHALQLIRKENI